MQLELRFIYQECDWIRPSTNYVHWVDSNHVIPVGLAGYFHLYGLHLVDSNHIIYGKVWEGCLMGLQLGDFVYKTCGGMFSYCHENTPPPMGILLSTEWIKPNTTEQWVKCQVYTKIPKNWVQPKDRWINTDIQ